ncbi:hypothetical protein AB0J71_02805 [Nonomuraea sp. NPDC049637]|uniref:hypothetical protein n=1 Tax=Nonomuraea sp. NPDC049637 TaxID=3154356 RepID=UPI00342CF4A9
MSEPEVTLRLSEAIELFSDLNEFVVSLDRIRSRIAFADASPRILVDYMVDRELFQRLARARELVGDAVEAVIGDERLEEIAEEGYVYPGDP